MILCDPVYLSHPIAFGMLSSSQMGLSSIKMDSRNHQQIEANTKAAKCSECKIISYFRSYFLITFMGLRDAIVVIFLFLFYSIHSISFPFPFPFSSIKSSAHWKTLDPHVQCSAVPLTKIITIGTCINLLHCIFSLFSILIRIHTFPSFYNFLFSVRLTI